MEQNREWREKVEQKSKHQAAVYDETDSEKYYFLMQAHNYIFSSVFLYRTDESHGFSRHSWPMAVQEN